MLDSPIRSYLKLAQEIGMTLEGESVLREILKQLEDRAIAVTLIFNPTIIDRDMADRASLRAGFYWPGLNPFVGRTEIAGIDEKDLLAYILHANAYANLSTELKQTYQSSFYEQIAAEVMRRQSVNRD